MSGSAVYSMTDAAIVPVTHVEAPEVVTSTHFDELLSETYERVGAQPGLLESLVGIKERRWWPEGYLYTDAAAAGAKAIEASGVGVDDLDLLTITRFDGGPSFKTEKRREGTSYIGVKDNPSACIDESIYAEVIVYTGTDTAKALVATQCDRLR